MEFNKEDEYKLFLLRSMPKQQLPPVQQEKILHQLRLAARENKRILDYGSLLKKLTIASAMFLVIFIPILLIVSHHPANPSHTPKLIRKGYWHVSPTFDLLGRDGSIVYKNRVRGIKGKIGFLDAEFIANDPRAGSKMFWYVWGNPEKLLNKELKAIATHEETGEKFVVDETELQGPIYGEDASALTSFKPFPKKGLWKIDVSIDGRSYGSIVVNVKAPNIATDNAEFILSRDDMRTGLTSDVHLEVKGDRKEKTIPVEASLLNNKSHQIRFPFILESPIHYATGEIRTGYTGKLNLDKPGKWKITVFGESTVVDVQR